MSAADLDDLVWATPAEQLRYNTCWVHRGSRVPGQVTQLPVMSEREAVTEALTILRRAGIDRSVLWWEARRRGPKRIMSMRTTLLLLLAWQVQAPERDTNFRTIIAWARDKLGTQNRARIGLTHPGWFYDLLLSTFHSFADLIDPEDSVLRIRPDGTIRERVEGLPSRDVLLNAMIAGSIPAAEPITPVVAIDSTDIPAYAALLANRPPNRADGDDEYIPDDVDLTEPDNLDQFKVIGLDGRRVPSKDPEARAGYRTVVMGKNTKTFVGWDAHLLVDAGWFGAERYVQYIRGMLFDPAGSHKGDAGIALIDSLHPDFIVDTIVADRGYSYAKAERWVLPLQERGITWVHDLHVTQRGRRTLMKHKKFDRHVIVDGTIFTHKLPKDQYKLPLFHPSMTGAEKAALAKRYDARAKWAFVPNGNPLADGSWQYRGPAYLGKVQCVNADETRRLNRDAPLTGCAEGDGCWCDKVPLIGADDQLRVRQKYIYGTTKWLSYYGMRNASESKNADMKHNTGTQRRGSTRVNGTTANAILFAIRCCAINVAARYHGWQGQVPLTATDTRTIPTDGRKGKSTPMHLRNGPKPRPDSRRVSQRDGKARQLARRTASPSGPKRRAS